MLFAVGASPAAAPLFTKYQIAFADKAYILRAADLAVWSTLRAVALRLAELSFPVAFTAFSFLDEVT